MPAKIYTIGHSNTKPEELLNKIKLYGIDTLVDVRSAPYSHYSPQFNKETISFFCANNNITYLFMGNLLGGKPKDNSVIDSNLTINYHKLSQKDYFFNGIDKLIEISSNRIICLMCSEGSPDKCHRNLLIAPALNKEGIEVLHILPNGLTESPNELSLSKKHGQLVLFS